MIANPSPQQRLIFEEFAHGHTHLVIKAYAGTGKTTTIVEAGAFAPERNILYTAFNNRIAKELTMRLAPLKGRAKAMTLHALGLRCVTRVWERIAISKDGGRADDLARRVCGDLTPDYIIRLVSKLHTKAREIAPLAMKAEELVDLAWQFECVPDNGWAHRGYDDHWVASKALSAMQLAAAHRPTQTGIDFADMIFLPVRNRWMYPEYDMVVVDEAQDMTVAQLLLAMGVCKGRIVIVGDENQAIYAFRGADSQSISRLEKELKAKVLGLTRTYRCGKSIVKVNQAFVPDFEADEANPDGVVRDLSYEKLVDEVQHGDFVLSRLNAPLASVAMALLRSGKRARIAGRDIGQGLRAVIRKLKSLTVEDFLEKLNVWEQREIARFTFAKREAQVQLARDKAETLAALCEGIDTVNELEQRVDVLFTDDGLGAAGIITCSSVHKAKGLESQRVFVLKDTLRGHSQEELNIQYVAFTRAKNELVLVNGRP